MLKEKYDVIVIGAGPAGLAAAIEAKKTGAQDVLVIERAQELGGILQQCIHNGFGLQIFKKDLPGPAYAQRFIDELAGLHIDTLLDAMVLNVSSERHVYATSRGSGFVELDTRAPVSYTHLRAHETRHDLVCRLLLEKKKKITKK